MPPVIEVEHVTKQFRLGQITSLTTTVANGLNRIMGRPMVERAPFKALDDVSFSVEPGEVLGIIGHNGAGKSTLLKILAGISKPSCGKATVRGRVAPLIEVGAGLVPDMTGRENVFLNAAILGMKRAEIKRKFHDIVAFAELEEFIDTPVKRYSSGMQIRLGFAIATSVSADILIVDEVLAVGDLPFQQKCIERMDSLISGEGRTVVIVGHNIRQIQRICGRTLLMNHGKIAMDGESSRVCGVFYEQAQLQNLERNSGAVQGKGLRPGQSSEYITVHKVDLIDESGDLVTNVDLHDPLSVRITFECHRAIQSPEIVVGLHTADFVQVVSVSNVASGGSPNFGVGTHTVTCRLSDVPLRPLTYGLRLAFLDRFRHMLWYADNLRQVLITAGLCDITKLPEIGLIDVPSDWKFCLNISP